MRACALLVVVSVAVPAAAGSFSAQMQVSVRVIARTILSVDRQPTTVQITAGDVARGYVDIPQVIAFRIRSNAVNGYALQFEPVAAPFSRAEITWNGVVMVIGHESNWMNREYHRGATSGVLNVRLLLAPTTQPGSYPWPIRLTAASL
jgi:hypothetical protein